MSNILPFIGRIVSVVTAVMLLTYQAQGAGGNVKIDKQDWSFWGIFGAYDQAQLQRGFQVYLEVCSSCHSLKHLYMRNLAEPGGPSFSEAELKQILADYPLTVLSEPNEDGEREEIQPKPFHQFPSPYKNDEEAASLNGGAVPPDLSLIAKARAAERGFPYFIGDIAVQYQEAGPDYIYALLTHYEDDPPAGVKVDEGLYYNASFLGGHQLAMAPPLSDELVEYSDGSPMTVDQYARDISAFLMWAAEPRLEERKRLGFKVMVTLFILLILIILAKRSLWARHH